MFVGVCVLSVHTRQGLLKSPQTGFSPLCRLWRRLEGLEECGDNVRSARNERDVAYFSRHGERNLLKSFLVKEGGRGINTATLLSG